MVTKLDYTRTEVEACFSVMVELMTLLGEYRNTIVLVGGWVPYFLFENKRHEHTGSLDIDIALDSEKISMKSYRTILKLLRERGYEEGEQPFIFYRTINYGSDSALKVEIDFLAGEYGGTATSHRTQRVQDFKARGCDLVFKDNFSIKLSGKMPDGAHNEVLIQVANVVPFLVMKGMALWERFKEKHAFDIYFTVQHFSGGIEALVREIKPHLSNKLVREGLGKIRKKFDSVNAIGPTWVANFEGVEDEEEKERIIRDAFERINTLLDALGIEPYEE